MLDSTIDIIRTTLKTDATLTPSDRARILALVRNGERPEKPPENVPIVLRRGEVARRLGRSTRSVDQLCAAGILQKVAFVGRKRACGILESSLLAAISAAA
jgi:hypothetical protein